MIPRSFGTHDGTFHADEVTACALLLVFDLIDRDKITRTRDNEMLNRCEYVCDVGGEYNPAKKRYDHHQNEYQGELSSAGMVWLDLWKRDLVDEETYRHVNRSLILGIDAHDIGKTVQQEGVCTFSIVIANFVPIAHEAGEDVFNKSFFEALDFVVGHLKRLFERYHYIRSCKKKVAKEMAKKKKYLVFDEPLLWQENFFELGGETHPALFVVMPSHGQWKLRGIPPTFSQRMEVREPMPKKWAGLRDEELEKASGIKGAIFCHKGRFISVWKTRENALKALKSILGEKS
ncbi:MAG: MYG1 family protein [Chlamydiae bacterium]|nr:MYG1 family protein [Chlamydiota bacterium]